MDPKSWGIDETYTNWRGEHVDVPAKTVQSILASMSPNGGAELPKPGAIVVEKNEVLPWNEPRRVLLEDGGEAKVGGRVPPDFPLGYHRLADEALTVICAPAKCHLPANLRIWGWTAQLYSARSTKSWGIGDFGDLTELLAWSEALGAGCVMINPLHASPPFLPQQPSPYFPTSRLFKNPLYLRIDKVPGAAGMAHELASIDEAGRALNSRRVVDRDAVFRLKLRALNLIWERQRGSFADARSTDGNLEDFATFCALSELHAKPWPLWPAEHRHPRNEAVRRFRVERASRVDFYAWLQLLIDSQLSDATSRQGVGLIQDLAVGVDPGGADAWLWQDLFAEGYSVGAPPDEFNVNGQNWGIPPFDPWKLAAAGYEPFIQTLRASMGHGAGLRIDHVMALWRLFWVPRGASPDEGTYVRYPWRDLISIVCLESVRAKTWVVGEDLGTVEPGVREALAERAILSQKVLWFEERDPKKFPAHSMAMLTTHDLPTVAGLWTGSESEESLRLGLGGGDAGARQLRGKLESWVKSKDGPLDGAIVKAHEKLARARSAVIIATLEDACAVRERPNIPGTTFERDNWSRALPMALEELRAAELPRLIAGTLRRKRRFFR